MDVILPYATLHDRDPSAEAALPDQLACSGRYIPNEYMISVLRHPYEVVLDVIHRMSACLVIDHASHL